MTASRRLKLAPKGVAGALVAIALALGACGDDETEGTPIACGEPSAYLAALESAPAEVTLPGGEPISGCLVAGQGGGDLADVGSAAITAADALNQRARRRPASEASVKLGYLVGAFEAGAAETGGIHTDLIRRLNASARFAGERALLPASFQRAFGRGYAIGRESG